VAGAGEELAVVHVCLLVSVRVYPYFSSQGWPSRQGWPRPEDRQHAGGRDDLGAARCRRAAGWRTFSLTEGGPADGQVLPYATSA